MTWLAIIALLSSDGVPITVRLPVADEAACHQALDYWANSPRLTAKRWTFVAGSCKEISQ